jgi:hypothetical protein
MDIAEKTVEGYWRRGSESNRRPRLCRPLHNHSATPPLLPQPDGLVAPLQCSRETEKLKRENGFSAKAHELHTMALCERIHFPCNWSGKRGSNSRPQPWQGCALPLSYSREIQSRHYKDAGIFVKKALQNPHPLGPDSDHIRRRVTKIQATLNLSAVFQCLGNRHFKIVSHRPKRQYRCQIN